MENASKALVMAAGVLIGIMIMSLAVYLFVSFGSETAKIYDKNVEQQVVAFNTEYTQYEGKELTIYNVVSVAKKARDNNKYYDVNSSSQENYIIVKLNGYQIETKKDGELQTLINNDIEKIDESNPNLDNYKCTEIKYDQNGKVKEINFN